MNLSHWMNGPFEMLCIEGGGEGCGRGCKLPVNDKRKIVISVMTTNNTRGGGEGHTGIIRHHHREPPF